MMFDVSHKTHYHYTWPVVQSQHHVHMSPRKVARQTVRHHSLIVEPAPAMRYDRIDAFGNPVVILDIEVPHKELVLLARSSIETMAPVGIDLAASTAVGPDRPEPRLCPGTDWTSTSSSIGARRG